MLFAKKSTANTTVRRVRLRSTMCVPPCDAGVKPIPPMPASRPLCMSTSDVIATTISTCITARNWSIAGRVPAFPRRPGAARGGQRASPCYPRPLVVENARERIQKLLVTGDNRLKQGVDPAKARESWEQALAVAREAGLEEQVRPLVEIRLADLERRGRRRG